MAQVPDGTHLGSLLTRTQLPAGWQQVTGIQPEEDSGSGLLPPASPGGQLHNCSAISFAGLATDFTGWWSVSYAVLIVQQSQNTGNIVNLTIAAYQPASEAAQTVSTATSLAGSCKSFTDSNGNRITVSAQPAPGIGTQSLYLTATGQTDTGTIVGQVLLAQTGHFVVGVDTNTGTSGPVGQAMIDQLGMWLVGVAASAG